MKAQVMAKIDSLLKPATINYDDYDISFVIPRYSPQPMPLDGNDKYLYMVEQSLKAKSGPSAKILIEAKVLEKVRLFRLICNLHCLDVQTFFQQKSDQKSKENTIEIHDTSEESDDEGKKRKKKHRKGSKVSICVMLLFGR